MRLKAILLIFCIILLSLTMSPAFSSNALENSWTLKTPMQQNRGGLGAVAVDGKVYAIGGAINCVYNTPSSTWEIVGTNEEYDPILDNWITKAPMPTARTYFAIATFQNKIYCFGGLIGTGVFPFQDTNIPLPGTKWCNTTEMYDPELNSWETKSAMPITQSVQFTATVIGNKIFLVGGAGAQPILVYDPITDQWDSPLGSTTNTTQSWNKAVIEAYKSTGLSTGDAQYTSTSYNENLYLLSRGVFVQGTRALFIYNIENQSWALGETAPPSDTLGITAVATSGFMAPARLYFETSSTNHIYNPIDDTWETGEPMPTSRFDFAAATVDDRIFIIGGYASSDLVSGMTTNEVFFPLGYGTIKPTIREVSLGNLTSGEISLNFIVDRPIDWIGYSIDGDSNVTISGNTTITGLKQGAHNITLFIKDTIDNFGSSETIAFQVENNYFYIETGIFILILIATISISLIFYYKKKHSNKR